MSAIGGKADIGAHCAIASDCSAINPAAVNFVFLQCEVVAYQLAASAEVGRDYRRFVVSCLAPEESQVSRCHHQRHSHFWQGPTGDCRRRQEPPLQRVHAVAVIYRY